MTISAFRFVKTTMSWRFTAAMTVFLAPGFVLAQADPSPNVEVVGVQVQKTSTETSPPSVVITVLIKQPGRKIIGVELDKSKIASFSDDKDTDLTKKQDRRRALEESSERFKDQDCIAVNINAAVLPARGSTSLRVKGAVALRIATGEKTIQGKQLKIPADEPLELGPVMLTRHSFAGQTYISVSYTGRILKSVEFLDAKGQPLPSEKSGNGVGAVSVNGGDAPLQFGESFLVAAKVDRVTVRVTYFDKIEVVIIPLDLNVGLGL